MSAAGSGRLQNQHFPYALAGDVIFCSDPKKGLHIEGFQRLRQVPNAAFTHAAIVAAPGEVMEAMWRKRAYCLSIGEWRRSRRETNRLTVLRPPAADADALIEPMMNASVYWLEQAYTLRAAIANDPSPDEGSTCAVLAARVLCRAGLLADSALPADRHLYPGALFNVLKDAGWIAIAPDDRYFEAPYAPGGSITQLAQIVSQGHRFERAMDALGETASGLNRYVREAYSGEAMSFFLSLQTADNARPIAYLRTAASSLAGQFQRSMEARSREPQTWKEGLDRANMQAAQQARLDEAAAHFLFVINRFSALDEGFFPIERLMEAMEVIKTGLAEMQTLDADAASIIAEGYIQDRVRFVAGYGVAPEDFDPAAFEPDWGELSPLPGKDGEELEGYRNLIGRMVDATRTTVETRRDGLLSRRPFLVHILGEEQVAAIDRQCAGAVAQVLGELGPSGAA